MSNKRKWTTTRKILTSIGLVLGATIIGIGVYAGYLYKKTDDAIQCMAAPVTIQPTAAPEEKRRRYRLNL